MKNIILLLQVIILVSCMNKMNNESNYFSEVVNHELEFGKLSETKGRKTAFTSNLSDSAYILNPLPVIGKPIYESVTDVPGQLVWRPEYALAANKGDIGFTTGPWKFFRTPEDTNPALGHYISVWKKFSEGWFIIFDGGISYNEQYPWPNEAINIGNHPPVFPERGLEQVINEFRDEYNSAPSETYAKYGHSLLRVYREGQFPQKTSELVSNNYFKDAERKTIAKEISSAGDFYYILEELQVTGEDNDTGYASSMQIWVTEKSSWKLLIDLFLIAEKE